MNGAHVSVASLGSDPVGWVIAISGAIVTLWTIVFAVRLMVSPGEHHANHPKHLILKDDR